MGVYNFYSGPSMLLPEVSEGMVAAIRNFSGTELSILEVSHRSKEFVAVIEEARSLVKEVMQLAPNREVLFMHGGALSQFHVVPMNLLNETETAAYIDTGKWASGAMEEAKLFGKVHLAASSQDGGYAYIPRNFSIPDAPKYVHLTSNNTIYGTQYSAVHLALLSALPVRLVADMSSDIFSRPIDFNRFDLIYAGAQKNIGPAGTTLVVVNKELLGTVHRPLPKMLDYRQHIAKDSMLNTPTVFAIYGALLTLRWIKKTGLNAIEEQNQRKAALLYEVLDRSELFQGSAEKESRSMMNVRFTVHPDLSEAERKSIETRFLDYCTDNGIVGIRGHRTVGGFRASLYNAMPEAGVAKLADLIREFERTMV